MVTDDSETFRMGNFESEVDGGTCRDTVDERSFQVSDGNTGRWCDQSLHGRSCMYEWNLYCWFCIIFRVPVPDTTHVCLTLQTARQSAAKMNGDVYSANSFVCVEIM